MTVEEDVHLQVTLVMDDAAATMTATPDSSAAPDSPVGLVAGTQLSLEDETAVLLRQRLKAAAVVILVALVLALVDNIFRHKLASPIIVLGVLLINVAALALMVSRRPLSMWQLRCIESLIFVGVGLQITVEFTRDILQLARDGNAASIGSATAQIYLAWTLLIFVYGIFVPNGWKRAAAALVPAALVPEFHIMFLEYSSADFRRFLPEDSYGLPVFAPMFAAVSGIYGNDFVQKIRRQVVEARQFGQYRLLERIGAGGMGEVFRAEHVLLKRPCALKLIRAQRADDQEAIHRFEREVKATATLTHWNTVEIFDYGRTDASTFYYVMEYLPGLSLEELVQRFGPQQPARVIALLSQVCEALSEAHHRGLVHRDIKPGNIFAAYRGGRWDVAKLLDFGLVKVHVPVDASPLEETREGTISGSPYYMAPEQVQSYSTVDGRTDIYALGAVGFFLLTGQPPYPGTTAVEVLMAHAGADIPSVRKLAPVAGRDLEQVLHRCLAKSPDERFADVKQLRDALDACVVEQPWTAESAAAWWSRHPGHWTAEVKQA